MKKFYLDLYAAFKLAEIDFINADVSPVKTIDRYRGQPLEPDLFEHYELPAIFVGRRINWQEENNAWQGEIVFNFHIVMPTQGQTGNNYNDYEMGLSYFDFLTEVRKVLDNFQTETISKLQRQSDEEVDTGVTVYEVINYKATIFDESAVIENYVSSENDYLEMMGNLVKKLN